MGWPCTDPRNSFHRTPLGLLSAGYSAGKDNTVVLDLTDRFQGPDRTVWIRTNMEICWDHAFMEVGRADMAPRQSFLEPVATDLNTSTGERTDPMPFHGMSRYPYGPDEACPDTPEHRRYQTRSQGFGHAVYRPER